MHIQHTGSAVFLIIPNLRGERDYIGYHWSVFSSIILTHKKKSFSTLQSLVCYTEKFQIPNSMAQALSCYKHEQLYTCVQFYNKSTIHQPYKYMEQL